MINKARIIEITIAVFMFFGLFVLIILGGILLILSIPFVALGSMLWQIIKLILGVLFILSGIALYFIILGLIHWIYPNPIIPQIAGWSVFILVFIVISPLMLAIVSSSPRTVIYRK
jgi:hypothetical protein